MSVSLYANFDLHFCLSTKYTLKAWYDLDFVICTLRNVFCGMLERAVNPVDNMLHVAVRFSLVFCELHV
jgi:hypothetical protein